MADKLMDAVAFLSLDNSKFKRGARQSEQRFSQMGATIKRIGAGIAGYMGGKQILSAVNNWTALGDAIEESSQRTGIAVSQLSRLKYAADLSGSSLEGVESAVRIMQKNISNKPTKKLAETLNYLRLSLAMLRQVGPENAFMTILYQLARVQDDSMRAALALNIFGKSGTQMLPLVADGYDGLVESMKKADEVGAVFTPEQASNAAAYQDAMQSLSVSWQGFLGVLSTATPALDLVTSALEKYGTLLKKTSDAVKGTGAPGDVGVMDMLVNGISGMYGGDAGATWNQYGTSEATLQNAKARNEKRRAAAIQDRLQSEHVASIVRGTGEQPNWDTRQTSAYQVERPIIVANAKARNERAKSRAIQENLMSAGVKSAVEGRQAVAANTQNTNYIVANGNFVAGPDMKRAVNRNKSARASI